MFWERRHIKNNNGNFAAEEVAMNKSDHDEIRGAVRDSYGKIALADAPGCGCASSACCTTPSTDGVAEISRKLGYSAAEVTGVPEGANLGLGCGNPQAIAALKPGKTVELPDQIKNDLALHTGCIAGASSIVELESMLRSAGFAEIRIKPKDESRAFIRNWAPGSRVEDYVVSATIEAVKPKS